MKRRRLVRRTKLTEGVSKRDRNLSNNEKTVLGTKLPLREPPPRVTDECGWRERQTERLERGREVMLWAHIMEQVMKMADTRWRLCSRRTLFGWRDEIETRRWGWGRVWRGDPADRLIAQWFGLFSHSIIMWQGLHCPGLLKLSAIKKGLNWVIERYERWSNWEIWYIRGDKEIKTPGHLIVLSTSDGVSYKGCDAHYMFCLLNRFVNGSRYFVDRKLLNL